MEKIKHPKLVARCITLCIIFMMMAAGIQAQDSGNISLSDLSAFSNPGDSWSIVGEVIASLEKENAIRTNEGAGILVNNPRKDQGGEDLFTGFDHGDIDLELDYMMPRGSNSGIYLQGRYEVQLRDSWTVKNPASGDNGGIYERPRDEGESYKGYAPRQNVSRAPGLWQHLEISFQAPRFDENGQKIANARMLSVALNGVAIHEDVELMGPTLGAFGEGEVVNGPLRFQGDHGAVAFRNINITRYDRPAPSVKNLEYKVYEGTFTEEPDLDTLSAVKSGKTEFLTSSLGRLPDHFLILYTGTIDIEEAGTYQFELNASGGGGLLRIGNNEVIPVDSSRGSADLSEGEVPFELFYARQADWGEPHFDFSVSAEGLRIHKLSDDRLSSRPGGNPIFVNADDKPLLRSFMDLPDGTRITHAISVSSREKIHYTYDLNHGSLVQVWRGRFLNATPMWYNRGDGSSRPEGSVEYLLRKPAFTLSRLENEKDAWASDTLRAAFKSRGYSLDKNENPIFLYDIFGTRVKDRIRVIRDGKGVKRTITLQETPGDLYFRLATGKSIKKGEKNRYLIDDQSYYIQIDNPTDSDPLIRTIDGHQELIIPAQSPLTYSILF